MLILAVIQTVFEEIPEWPQIKYETIMTVVARHKVRVRVRVIELGDYFLTSPSIFYTNTVFRLRVRVRVTIRVRVQIRVRVRVRIGVGVSSRAR